MENENIFGVIRVYCQVEKFQKRSIMNISKAENIILIEKTISNLKKRSFYHLALTMKI